MEAVLKNGWTRPFLDNIKHVPIYFLQPIRIIKGYNKADLQPDLMAGLTVAIILLPQAIAVSLIAELPPEMGLYAAIVTAIIGALWGSSNQTQTGPTNAIALLILSVLLTISTPGTTEFIIAAGMMAVIAGLFQLMMGLARLGVLVNFVSHSVIVGFSSGAGVLIAASQIRHLLGLEFSSHNLIQIIEGFFVHISETDWATTVLGISTMFLIVGLKKVAPKLPGPLIAMVAASIAVFLFNLDEKGVAVIGQLPSSLPPLANLPLFDLDFIMRLSTGALAVGAIGLVETAAIARSISTETGQRLDSNQEFVGQGLANIAAGLFSGCAVAGSFSRSAVNLKAEAKSPMSSVFSGLFVLFAMLTLSPLAVYLPRAALAGVLILTAYGMLNEEEIKRIWHGAPEDAFIMVVTFLGTLFLAIEVAVLLGIVLSFVIYIVKTSVPHINTVMPDEKFSHFVHNPHKQLCSQLGIVEISGDLYFGAVRHIEEFIHQHRVKYPDQHLLLLRMRGVNQSDFSVIHALETIANSYRSRGGDMFISKVRQPVMELMKSTGFYDKLGEKNFLEEGKEIDYLFYKILDPAICIYECPLRVFKECQNLPKLLYNRDVPLYTDIPTNAIADISSQELWAKLFDESSPPLVIDVREPREFKRGHIPKARLIPLYQIAVGDWELPPNNEIICVCQSGRRSIRAAHILQNKGYNNVRILQGGMLAWNTAKLLEAIGE